MKMLRNALIIAAVVLILGVTAIISFLPKIVLGAFSSTYNLDIQYKNLKKATLTGMAFDGLTIVDKAKGIGISSENATIALGWNGLDPRNATICFDFYDVRFVKRAVERALSYDTLDGLVALPFSSNWLYKEISGKVHSSKEGVTIRDFLAKSDLMKLAFNGSMQADNTIKSDIIIYFADDLTKKIPPELIKLVLTPGEPGWKSLSVKLEGNYTMPTIQVSSKLFRLNIGVKDPS